MKLNKKLNILMAAAFITGVLGVAATSQAMSDKDIATANAKKISKQEWERARNYFTDTPLVDQNGNKLRFYSDVLDGKVVILNVMYTSCKGSCPITTQMLNKVRQRIGKRFGKDIHFVSISNNPDKDSPAELAKFAKKQNAVTKGWTFLTGDKKHINQIVKKLGFFSQNHEAHTAMLIAGNTRTGHWIKIKPGSPMPGIVLKLNSLADEG